ncbi:hypothetical protein [Candidatus Rickettsia kedanie]|uniref:Ankyrin repeat domain-containing protein n=1 Tax=Candidatus Rickettsia kedanie TaxID=3115352 RepID=A0ABP9TWT3_9RICK
MRVVVKGKDKEGVTKYLVGKEVAKEQIFMGVDYGDAMQHYSFPKIVVKKNDMALSTASPMTLANKALFENTLIKLHNFTTDPAIELHHYDKVTSQLENDVQLGPISNQSSYALTTRRNLDTTLLFDLDKVANPTQNLKTALDQECDRKYDGANLLLNKLLVNDKEGLIKLLDEGYNINALNADRFNVVLLAAYRDDCKDLLKAMIEKYGADVNLNTYGIRCRKDHKLNGASSLLDVAILKEDIELTKYLIAKGAAIKVDGFPGHVMQACNLAKKTDNMEMLDLFFSQGVSIKEQPVIHELANKNFPKK